MSNQIFSSTNTKYIGLGNYPELTLSRSVTFNLTIGGEGLVYQFNQVDKSEIPAQCITANSGIFTVKKACSLLIKAQISYAGAALVDATKFYETGLQINDDLSRDFPNQKSPILTPTLSLLNVIHNITYFHKFQVNDTFSIRVFQNSAAAVQVLGNDDALSPHTTITIIQIE